MCPWVSERKGPYIVATDLKTDNYILVLIAQPINGGLIYNSDHAITLGISPMQTSFILGISGLINTAGRIITGKIMDIFPSKIFILTLMIMLQLSLVFSIGDFFPTITGQVLVFGVFGFSFGAYGCTSAALVV